MDQAKTLEELKCILENDTPSDSRTAKILSLMRHFIVSECSDYNKISERLHVLKSEKMLTVNRATSGYDIAEAETDSKFEHKGSYIKTTSKPHVNAQMTPTFSKSLFERARNLISEKKIIDSGFMIVVAGTQTFSVHRPLWEAMDADIKRKMANENGGMQIDWYNARTHEDKELFVGTIAYRLEAARWLGNICNPERRFPKNTPSLNLGGSICKKCGFPHRLARLAKWSLCFKKMDGISVDSTLEELAVNIPQKELEKFYAPITGCAM